MSGDELHDQELEQAFAALDERLPRVAPRPDLFDDIRRRITIDAEPAPPAVVSRRRRRRRPLAAGLAIGFAAAAAVVLAIVLTGRSPGPDARGVVTAHGSSGAHGSVAVFHEQTAGGYVVLHLRGLAAAAPGTHYTVWVLRRRATQMTPIGSFSDGSRATFELPLPGPGTYRALDISLQRNNASPVHSRTSVAGAVLG